MAKESNLSPLAKQLNRLKQQLHQLCIKKYDYNSSLVAIHILKGKIDLSSLKKQAQSNASSSSGHNTYNAVYTHLLDL